MYASYVQENNLPEQFTYEAENTYNMWGENLRIDFVFAIDGIGHDLPLLKLKCKKMEVIKQPPKKELSDHWPSTATIVPQ